MMPLKAILHPSQTEIVEHFRTVIKHTLDEKQEGVVRLASIGQAERDLTFNFVPAFSLRGYMTPGSDEPAPAHMKLLTREGFVAAFPAGYDPGMDEGVREVIVNIIAEAIPNEQIMFWLDDDGARTALWLVCGKFVMLVIEELVADRPDEVGEILKEAREEKCRSSH